ncbi:MAG: ribonucleoside-triphosphate reductase [Stutzerimonas stutzeri]|nr:MAG: ribonucleoside-triphosphate reductase [Stutzerimonas stutzeri]
MSLPTDYQSYIHKSRYARFLDAEGRRENWDETVDRYLDYYGEELEAHHGYRVSPLLRSEVRDAILNLHVMPSMRALMTAGEAARRENLATYNCSYLPIDRPKAFAEALYILMCGTGVGFSVERQIIKKLPDVPEKVGKTDRTIVVGDSKLGWAEAYHELILSLYAGYIPSFDTSAVRPAGARLKVFGGRASGPEPLLDLFEFTIRTFVNAAGRKLNSLEVHEIVTKTGDIVVVGGVRRSALISLSNLSDQRMRDAKAGNWWDTKPHLQLANNSVAYTEKPDTGAFMDEWSALYRSKSGERGIFNRAGSVQKILKLGRRDHRFEFGANPCAEIILRPRGLCNLSEAVVRAHDSIAEMREKVRLAAIIGTWQSTQTRFQFVDPEWKQNAEEERLLGVSLTGIYDNELMRGDRGLAPLAIELNQMKSVVIRENRMQAEAIGINPSVATTTIKPSGTVSQLVNSPSGIHQGHAKFYIRRVTGDNKDPVTQFMVDSGIPYEPHASKPQAMTVFSFPVRLGAGTKARDDVTAIQHLELVKTYNEHWSEHAVSCTISVKEHEWPSVGGWVFDHFDALAGVSFLPHFAGDSTYKQMPYETITALEYVALAKAMPDLDWTKLAEYERGEDSVTGTREFACVGNTCEIVDSVKPV